MLNYFDTLKNMLFTGKNLPGKTEIRGQSSVEFKANLSDRTLSYLYIPGSNVPVSIEPYAEALCQWLKGSVHDLAIRNNGHYQPREGAMEPLTSMERLDMYLKKFDADRDVTVNYLSNLGSIEEGHAWLTSYGIPRFKESIAKKEPKSQPTNLVMHSRAFEKVVIGLKAKDIVDAHLIQLSDTHYGDDHEGALLITAHRIDTSVRVELCKKKYGLDKLDDTSPAYLDEQGIPQNCLSMTVVTYGADLFTHVPFEVPMFSLLLLAIADKTNMLPGMLTYNGILPTLNVNDHQTITSYVEQGDTDKSVITSPPIVIGELPDFFSDFTPDMFRV